MKARAKVKKVVVKRPTPAVYGAVMLEVERRRLELGFAMEKFCEWAGIADRSFAKYLHPDTPSGRVATWDTLEVMMAALYPHGYRITIEAAPGQVVRPGDVKAQLLKLREKFPDNSANRKTNAPCQARAA